MQRLLNIARYFKEYVLLALLLLVSLALLLSNDNSQVRAIRSYTIGAIGVVQSALAVIPNVFELQRENAVLRQLNVNLSDEVSRLRGASLENMRLREMLGMRQHSPFHLVAGDVVGKSLHLMRNTITINIGTADGVQPDMPILSESGLVGRVIASSAQYSIGQLLINKDFRGSAKVLRSRVDGIITWSGGSTLTLKNVSKKQDVRVGDVVVTSAYSSMFPPDIKIGTVIAIDETPGSLFKEIEILPSTDFVRLEQVFVVLTLPTQERTALEQQVAAGAAQ